MFWVIWVRTPAGYVRGDPESYCVRTPLGYVRRLCFVVSRSDINESEVLLKYLCVSGLVMVIECIYDG